MKLPESTSVFGSCYNAVSDRVWAEAERLLLGVSSLSALGHTARHAERPVVGVDARTR